jgi:hypothetical protein
MRRRNRRKSEIQRTLLGMIGDTSHDCYCTLAGFCVCSPREQPPPLSAAKPSGPAARREEAGEGVHLNGSLTHPK